MIKLFIVRHGETTYNAEGRIQGHKDSPLSALGVKQAYAITTRLESECISAIYSSDLQRAAETARIIAKPHKLTVNQTPLLRESCLGIIEGLTHAEIEKLYPASDHKWRLHALEVRPPGAEKIEDVISRCNAFLLDIIAHHKDGDSIAIVGHGGSVRGMILSALKLPIENYRKLHFSNASLSILEIGNDASLWLMNDTCHLDSLRTSEEEVDNIAH